MVKLNCCCCCCCCCCCWTTHLVTYCLYENVRILLQYIFTASLSLCFRNSTDGWRSGYKWNGKYMKSLFNKRRWRESSFSVKKNIWCVFRVKPSLSNFSIVVWTKNIWCVFRVKLLQRCVGVIILFLISLQSVLDAQWLAYQVQMYYASQGDHREDILFALSQCL